MDRQKLMGSVSIISAVLILFTSMIDPIISMAVSITVLLIVGGYLMGWNRKA